MPIPRYTTKNFWFDPKKEQPIKEPVGRIWIDSNYAYLTKYIHSAKCFVVITPGITKGEVFCISNVSSWKYESVIDYERHMNNKPQFKISILFALYDLWMGIFWDKKKKWLYILPIPTLGIILKFRK